MTEEEMMIKWAMNEGWDAMNYQVSMEKRDKCAEKSRESLHNNDLYMFKFWSNASREFEKRAVEQLSETLKRKKRAVEQLSETLKRKKKVVLHDRFAQNKLPFIPIAIGGVSVSWYFPVKIEEELV